MIDSFDCAVKYLEQFVPTPDKKHPGQLGLMRMQYFMGLLGNPELRYPTIHVGGTSGKGSTSTIIATILAAKYKVGLHTSPHLMKINERIKVMQQCNNTTMKQCNISDKEFINLVNYIIPYVEKVGKSNLGPPSYFEIVTAMAFLYFYHQKVDIAVIEVGMGGRFDATNVVKPEVAVLTNVGLDHTEILGDTVEKIAEDKAGIIKSGIQVVSGVRQESVIKIIKKTCREKNAYLSLMTKSGSDLKSVKGLTLSFFSYQVKKLTPKGCVFDYSSFRSGRVYKHIQGLTLRNMRLSLPGEYQVENAALAIRVIEELERHSGDSERSVEDSRIDSGQACLRRQARMTEEEIRKGLQLAYISGRLEIISKKPLVILDGAHNPDKARALVDSIGKIFPKRKVTGIIAIKEDKKANEILEEFLKVCKRVIFTNFQLTSDMGLIKSYKPEELLRIAQIIDKNKRFEVIVPAKKALEKAIQSTGESDLILVTGSLYLVGEISKFLMTNF